MFSSPSHRHLVGVVLLHRSDISRFRTFVVNIASTALSGTRQSRLFYHDSVENLMRLCYDRSCLNDEIRTISVIFCCPESTCYFVLVMLRVHTDCYHAMNSLFPSKIHFALSLSWCVTTGLVMARLLSQCCGLVSRCLAACEYSFLPELSSASLVSCLLLLWLCSLVIRFFC